MQFTISVDFVDSFIGEDPTIQPLILHAERPTELMATLQLLKMFEKIKPSTCKVQLPNGKTVPVKLHKLLG